MAEENLKILVVEDDETVRLVLKKLLSKHNFNVATAENGFEAKRILEEDLCDILITDWMMPQVDGAELIRNIRKKIEEPPLIIVVSTLISNVAKNYILETGADYFISKPIQFDELLNVIDEGLQDKKRIFEVENSTFKKIEDIPNFNANVIVAGTGGPPAILEILKNIKSIDKSVYYIVQHGPEWLIETLALKLEKATGFNVHIGSEGMKTKPGNIYIAPGDHHMLISNDLTISLNKGAKENFERPSVDPLCKSLATKFKDKLNLIILSGIGHDGYKGVNEIHGAKGNIIAQDPDSALEASMPISAIESGKVLSILNLKDISDIISS